MPLALLLLVGATAGVVNSQSIPTERLGIAAASRRTAAGQRSAQQQAPVQQQPPYDSQQTAGQQPRALRDRANRTPFVAPQAAKPANAPAPQLLDDRATSADTTPLPVVQDLIAMQPAAQTPEPPIPIATPVPGPAPGRRAPPAPPVADAPQLLQLPAPLNTAPLKAATQNPASETAEKVPSGKAGDSSAHAPPEFVPAFVPLQLSGIDAVTTSISAPAGEMPRNFAALAQSDGPQDLAPPGEGIRVTAPFYSTPRVADFTFRPLYFEERALERNGRSIGILQPGLSFVHFFGTVPMLPYKMGANPPSRPQFTGNGIDLPSDHLSWRDRFRGVMTASGFAIGLSAALP